MTEVLLEPVPDGAAEEVARRGLYGTLIRNPLALCGLIILAAIVFSAVFANLLAPMDPFHPDLKSINAAPGVGGHVLGADSSGRDILSGLLVGAQQTLIGAVIAVLVSLIISLPTGLAAGYYGGKFDAVASWFTNILLSLPAIVVLLAVVIAVGPNIYIIMSAFGVLISPGMFRLVRAQVMNVKNELYVDAARVSGLSNLRIIGRHVLYVVRAPIIILGSMRFGLAITVQAGIEFLGLGNTDRVSWGGMLNDAFSVIYLSPAAIIWPGLAIAVAVAAFILVGNGIRDALQGAPAVRATRRARRVKGSRERAQPSGDHALEIRGLKVGYPQARGKTKIVVHDVSLTVDRGTVLGLVGESGSGKTQTAFSILGLLPVGGEVLGGDIFVSGRNMLGLPGADLRKMLGRDLAYIPQEPMSNLDPAFTIGHQLVEPLRRAGLSKKDARAKSVSLLSRVGIADPERTMRSYPHQISGGMAQRVLIAGAISNDPALLIADEPTTALDVTVQAEVLSLLRSLQEERNMAVVLVTHNFGVVADLCDTVAVMQHGRIVESGEVERVFSSPQHPYTKMLLSSTLEDSTPRQWPGTTPAEAAESEGVAR